MAKWRWHTKESPLPIKAGKRKSKSKSMLITFFDIWGIVHKEFESQGQKVKQTDYRQVLEKLRKGSFVSGQTLLTLGCFITITLHVTKWAFLWYHTPLTPLILVHVIISYFQKLKANSGAPFWKCRERPKDCDGPAKGIDSWRLPALFQSMGTMTP